MPAPATTSDFLDIVRKSRLVDESDLTRFRNENPDLPEDPIKLAAALRASNLLTGFQSDQLLRGKYRGFVLGKYKLLDRIGLGGMGQVFLAEHGMMKKRVALKVLPPDRSQNQFARERFVREARTTGQLEHPNLIKAYDLDSDNDVHFLVLEYVDGICFQDLVVRNGPLDAHRAAYYLWQAASGLAYLSGKGLVHRDIKPANIIVDRVGAVKILDLGLVREEEGGDDLTKREDVKFLGTADYLAPEQMANCSTVDVRADLYALGATGYFLLTGKSPYGGTTIAEKLIAAQTSEARAAHLVNPTVPLELSVIITKLMAKKVADRYQTPEELLAVLDPWAEMPPEPLAEKDFPNRDGSQSTPLPNSAVALSFNLMKAARGGSGGSSSSRNLEKQATSSSLRLHVENATTTETKTEMATAETPSPSPMNTPGPVASRPTFTPIKPLAAAAPKEAKKPRKGPPPLLVAGIPALVFKVGDKSAEAPLVDLDALRNRTNLEMAALTAQKPKTQSVRFWGFLKSLFSRNRSDEAVVQLRDSTRL